MLEEVDMSAVELSSDEWDAIFQALCGEVNLRSLDVSGNDLHLVDPDMLSTSLCKLEKLAIRRAKN